MNLSTQSLAFQQHQPSFLASYIPDFTNVEESFHKLVQMTASWPSRKHQSERDRFSSTSLGALFSTSPTSTSPSASSPASSTSSVRMAATISDASSLNNNNNCEKPNKNRLKSDYGADTDCETHPPSDSEQNDAEPEVNLVLLKMEELNKLNEQDARSVTSRKSGSSSSNVGNDSPSRHNSCHPDDDENLDLWTIWGDLVKNWETELRKRPNYVKDLVKQGVPQHFRTITWQLLSCANAASIHDVYSEYMRTSSPYEKVIMRDIPRTYPELEFFKDHGRGQAALFNVIKAYSIHDKEVGYCQGSAFIVGQLLLQMPEEEAFAVCPKKKPSPCSSVSWSTTAYASSTSRR
uniref:Rab-GAP TBC domain-containing protein n=1 Tax=Steinernema glaseri TaxID=37863 RepID=A0A1I7ZJC2_9BILA